MYFLIFFCRFYDFSKKLYYYIFGDNMNFLEVGKILNKMIDNTRIVVIDLEVTHLMSTLSIDKNSH